MSGGTSMDRCGPWRVLTLFFGFSGRSCPLRVLLTASKLVVFVGILVTVGNMARRGLLPRTRPIVPGEWAVS